MISEFSAKCYCIDDISLIQNYDNAIADTNQTWECHHIAEILPCVSNDLQTLVDGGAVSKNLYVFIDHEWLENYNRSDFWSFQVYAGYLTPSKDAVFDIDHEPIDLVIPNTSIFVNGQK